MRSTILASLLVLSCSAVAAPQNPSVAPGKHSSCETAIKVQGNSHFEGIDNEYVWLSKNYPGYRLVKQSLVQCPNGPADAMVIVDQQEKNATTVVFDLSAVWGKGLEGL